MTSIGLRPALLFFSFTGVTTPASISARKLSNGTTRAIISNGSPFAVIAASRRSASKNPNCPIVPTPANLVVTTQTRTNSRRSLFFEVPISLIVQFGATEPAQKHAPFVGSNQNARLSDGDDANFCAVQFD